MGLSLIFIVILGVSLVLAAVGPVAEAAQPLPVPGPFTINNPYTGGTPLKGQLHAHTENTNHQPGPVQAIYRDHGYDFLAITDHGVWTAPDPKVTGIITLTASEAYAREGHRKDIRVDIAGRPSIYYYEANHPNRADNPWTKSELSRNTQIDGLEVYNPIPFSESENKWDSALLHPGLRPVWGSAVDDYHGTGTDADFDYSGGKGWVMVYAKSPTALDIIHSLYDGNFYATTGPEKLNISVTGKTITLITNEPATIEWKKSGGRTVKTGHNVTASSYTCSGPEIYVRAVITRNQDGKKAWTQPFFLESLIP